MPRSGPVAECVERIWTCERADASGEQLLLPTGRSLGYADQSHMTRDFAEYAGVTPASLHGDGSTSPNHVDH